MAKGKSTKRIASDLTRLVGHLDDIQAFAKALQESRLDAGEAQSITDAKDGARAARDNIGTLQAAIEAGRASETRAQAEALQAHIRQAVARQAITDDLSAVVDEVIEDLSSRVGMHRNPYKSFIEDGNKLLGAISAAAGLAEDIFQAAVRRAAQTDRKEADMAQHDEEAGIVAELQGIGRQLSFLATGSGVIARAGVTGSGAHRSVSQQLMVSLDARGLPHSGVQFATGAETSGARSDLIEGLLDTYRATERDGNVIYVPGRTEDGRLYDIDKGTSLLLSGAARVAARLVRAEADNILDILDRLPKMVRFRIRPGVPSASDARGIVADRFAELDEVMADPIGVNLPRAWFTLRRAVKALLDFFDYANLERELVEQFGKFDDLRHLQIDLPQPVPDDDEVGLRRSVVQSEEIRREIAEVAAGFARLAIRVVTPIAHSLGTTAARLEQSLTVARDSARELSDILVRSGSSLPEQDVHFFMSGIKIEIDAIFEQARTSSSGTKAMPRLALSLGQILDWIVEVADPYTAASNLSSTLEQGDLDILADELNRQKQALDAVTRQSARLGFAYRLPGPSRQLEELAFHIKTAAQLAHALAQADQVPSDTEE